MVHIDFNLDTMVKAPTKQPRSQESDSSLKDSQTTIVELN